MLEFDHLWVRCWLSHGASSGQLLPFANAKRGGAKWSIVTIALDALEFGHQ
ncbi:hypothetical protein TR2A62_0773 [Thalassobium sp. R2A62]|nr:hypothetical protein TR2A62_0773 [Thalassobium sp. R2A62]